MTDNFKNSDIVLPVYSIGFSKIEGDTRKKIPGKDETIYTDYDEKKFPAQLIKEFSIYKREPRDCPWARGNWMIDFIFKDRGRYCIRLPLEMDESDVMRYMQPLVDKIINYKDILENDSST